jgi:hypothetical protein
VAHRSVSLGRVLIVRWETAPTAEDVASVLAHARHLTSTLGAMVYVSLTPKRAFRIALHKANDPSEMIKNQRELLEHATETHLLIENQPVVAAAVKGALAVIQTVAKQHVVVHSKLEELIADLARKEKLDPDFLRRELGRLVLG